MKDKPPSFLDAARWPIAFIALLLLAWEGAVRYLGIRSIVLPPPSEIAVVMATRYDLLLSHLWPSLYLTIAGCAVCGVGGVPDGVLIPYSEILRRGRYPLRDASHTRQKISIGPLFSLSC